MSLEFELPLVSLIFMIFLSVIYFNKEKVELVENNMYKKIIIYSLVEIFINTVIHIICALNDFSIISTTYYPLFNFLNKILSTLFVGIFVSLFNYILIITFPSVRDNYKKVEIAGLIVEVVFFIVMLFTNIKLVEIGNVTNVVGSTATIGYIVVAILIFLSFVVSIKSGKKDDKRYYSIYFIMGMLAVLYLFSIVFPGMIIYDVVLSLLCYMMYFTIENPDMKMNRELQIARDQALKANNAKTEFLSSMSHEIRTPLNAIVGFSDCILESETLSEAKDNAADIVNASETLLDIVNGILDISKIEAGKIEIINSIYNAPNTYLELAKLITPKMEEKGLDFSFNIAPDLPKTLLGDHANIKKIVTNLLSNACKYTDRGFVHYEVNCVNSGGVCKLIISVEDSGRGIKKESVDKMFTKFQRLDEDRNTTIEGTGLGLAITKQLTELMGGRILVHTVFGQGSKFTVVINQKIEKDEVVDNKKVKTTLDLTDVKLLIVDDNQLNLKVAKKLFEKFNANHIISCESGFECLDKIKRGEIYDVILLDDMMPKMSGTETLAELKKIPGFRIPVVALTANAISGMREKYLSEGFDDYLAKPIEKNEFIRVMNELLGRSNTEEIEVVSEVNEPVITNQENVRDEIIVPEEKKPLIIPVEDNIEEILGSQVELSSEHEVIEPKIEEIKVDQIEMLDVEEPVRDDIVIPNLVPVVDIDLEAINSSVTEESTKVEVFDRAYLESNGVDVNHALELLGDMEMYNMTINDFMKEIDEKWNRIISCRDSKDMPNYAIDVHSLKSDCKYLGFMTLADISYQHELKSKENDVEFVLNNFAQLEEEYHKMYEIAKNYAEHNKVEE